MSTQVKAQNTTTLASVKEIYEAANEASGILDTMQEAAEAAGTTLDGIYADAESAKSGAESATSSAAIALNQLDIIENVVGVLELVSKNGSFRVTPDMEVLANKWYFTRSGTSPNYEYSVVINPTEIQYELTSDQAIDPNKTYYTRSGSGTSEDPYIYTMVDEPDVSEIGTYYECIYYELIGIDSAIQNYVSSHLVLDGSGLWLQSDGASSKLQLSPTGGVIIYNENNDQVAQYGTDTVIGDPNGFHIKLDSTNNEIGFYEGDNKIAYMSGSALYVSNRLSFGHFQFVERDNGHFSLKLIS